VLTPKQATAPEAQSLQRMGWVLHRKGTPLAYHWTECLVSDSSRLAVIPAATFRAPQI